MAKSIGVLLALGVALLPPALAHDGHGRSGQGVKVQTLASRVDAEAPPTSSDPRGRAGAGQVAA